MGCLAGLLVPKVPALVLAPGLLGMLLPAAIPRDWNPGKFATRFLPSLVAAFLVVQGLRGADIPGALVAAAVLAGVGLAVIHYRRRGPWRGPCLGCPEREDGPCTGFRAQFRRERAFRRLAGRMLAEAPLGLPGEVVKMDPTSE